ncbi:MAG: Ig-like domain-containing protein [Anaerolineae bacterium]
MRWLSLILILALCACNLVAGQPATPTPAVPTIAFQFPTNNVAVVEGTDLQIQLLAQDTVGVARIELLVDGIQHQNANPVDGEAVPVFTVDMNWLAEGVGLHALQATAYRLDGTSSRPTMINVNVTSATPMQTPAPG